MVEPVGRYVEVRGFRTYFESAGEGVPIICISTAGADGREFRHFLEYFGENGYRAIALDMPGHGKSYPNLDTLQVIDTEQEWIDFIWAFVERLRLDRPVFVGAAMSASALLVLAAQHGSAVRAVVAAGATAQFYLDPFDLDMHNHPQVNTADYKESSTRGLCGRDIPGAAMNECIWLHARNATPEVIKADLVILARHDVRERLPRIMAPVLHLRGEDDPTVSDEQVDLIRKLVPNVSLTTLKGVGHFPMVEDPGAFNSAVAEFLTRVAAPTPPKSDALPTGLNSPAQDEETGAFEAIGIDWANRVKTLLEASAEFRRDGRALSGSLYVYDDRTGVTIRFDRGSVLEVRAGTDVRGARYRLGGSHEAWRRAFSAAVDFASATDGTKGRLALDADLLRVAGNAKAFMILWQAMKEAAAPRLSSQSRH